MEDRYIKLAEAYLSGKLSDEEMQAFEEELQSNQELRNACEEVKMAMDAVEVGVENELQEKFEEWTESPQQQPVAKRPIRMVLVAGIAASLVMLGAVMVFLQVSPDTNYENLALKYYTPPELAGGTMGPDDANWNGGQLAYNAGNYSGAVEYWLQIGEKNEEVSYFLAQAFFQMGEYVDAIDYLEPLKGSGSAFSTPAEWYLCLSYLANDDLENFQDHLYKIIDSPDHPFYKQALRLEREFGGYGS